MAQNAQSERFHYCLPMEMVEWELFGIQKRPHGMAAAFANCGYLKKRAKAFLRKIRRRVNEVVTNDETLRILLNSDLESLGREFGRMNAKTNNDIDIFADFFMFVIHLLGWAHSDGNLYRTPIFYQTETQQEADLHMLSNKDRPRGLYGSYKRRQIIKSLLAEGENYASVALVMGMSVTNVKHLEKAEHIDRWYKNGLFET